MQRKLNLCRHNNRPWLEIRELVPIWFPLDDTDRLEGLWACAIDPDQCRTTLGLIRGSAPALRAVLQHFLDYPDEAAWIEPQLFDLLQERLEAEAEGFGPEHDEEIPYELLPTNSRIAV